MDTSAGGPEKLIGNEATRFKKGVSGNPGGRPKGYEPQGAVYARLRILTEAEFKAYKPKNMAEKMAKRAIVRSGWGFEGEGANDRTGGGKDAMIAIRYEQEIHDRTDGKATQAAEIKVEDTTVNPIERGDSERDKAMAAVELMRSAGIDVPAALQAMIEAGDDDE